MRGNVGFVGLAARANLVGNRATNSSCQGEPTVSIRSSGTPQSINCRADDCPQTRIRSAVSGEKPKRQQGVSCWSTHDETP